MTCPHRFDDGAYVLGALCPTERAEFEQHLANCGSCASAVRLLAPLPGLLGRVDPVVAEQGLPGASRLPRLIDAMVAARRRQSRLTRLKVAAVALAAALLAGGGTMVLQGSDDPAPPVATGTQVEEMVAAVDWVPVAAQLRIAEEDTGTTIAMDCRYQNGYAGQRQAFRLVAVGTDGSDDPLGSWLARPGDHVTMTGLTRFTGTELARVELRDAAGTVLLYLEP
ncbi:MAG TPA: zf-HC2 domain-containing protein [Natronosporangium sp.]|nr:zf-HC2 domain-containing protein [Natronosporangium sp.]